MSAFATFFNVLLRILTVFVYDIFFAPMAADFFFLNSSAKITNELVSIQKSRTRQCSCTKVFVPHSSFYINTKLPIIAAKMLPQVGLDMMIQKTNTQPTELTWYCLEV